MKNVKHHAWALLVLALPLADQVSASTLMDTSVTMSNIQVKLADLTPNDGVNARIEWLPDSAITFFTADRTGLPQANRSDVSGGIFDAGAGSASVDGVSSSKSGLTQHVNASMSTEDANAYLQQVSLNDHNFNEFKVYGSLSTSDMSKFRLAPHSQITISGDLLIRNVLDVDALSQSSVLKQIVNAGHQVQLHSQVAFTLNVIDPSEIEPVLALSYRNVDVSRSLDGAFFVDGSYLPLDNLWIDQNVNGNSMHFSLTVENDKNVPIIRQIDYSRLSASTNLFVAGIPEPGTWALMSLGLIGIAAAARRRSA